METMVVIMTDSSTGNNTRWYLMMGPPIFDVYEPEKQDEEEEEEEEEEAEEQVEKVEEEVTKKWKQAIYILWTTRPGQSHFGFENMDCIKEEGIPATILERARTTRDRFAKQIARRAYYSKFASELVFVNMEPLLIGWQAEGEEPMETHGSRRKKWEELLDRELKKRYKYVRDSWTEGDHENRYKTLEEMDKVKVKFITMEEYLADYDWTGEFIAEEITPWLESGSGKRKRSEEELSDDGRKRSQEEPTINGEEASMGEVVMDRS
jgi:hypothetical protein